MKLTIGKKLLGLVGMFIILIGVIWAFSTINLKDVQEADNTAMKTLDDKQYITEKEVDHLNWINSLTETFTMDKDFEQQLDPHKCDFGKWYYEFIQSEEFNVLPEKAQLALRDIEEPHRHLHESAGKIKEKFNPVDVSLDAMLADRWIDHLNWVNELNQMFLTGRKFTGSLDAHQCGFGKWYYGFKTDDNEFQSKLNSIEHPHVELHEAGAEIVKLYESGQQAKAMKIFQDELLPKVHEVHGLFANSRDYIVQAVNQKNDALGIYQNETMVALNDCKEQFSNLSESYNNMAEEIKQEAADKASSSITLTMIIAIIAAAIGLILGIFISRNITGPVQKALDVTQKIANYDLTCEPLNSKSKDEIGDMSRALDTMTGNLSDIISTVAGNTDQLASASTEISSSSEELSAGVKEQTNQTSQVSTAVEEMTATIVESTKNIADANDKAKNAGEKSQEGSNMADEASRGMDEIVESSNVTSKNIEGLSEKATAIGEIISVIDDIADQTNLLALNAAIEAARAGEQGRGFAVVADEVRKLAERTTKATKEVADNIKGIQADVSTAATQVNDSNEIVTKGKDVVQKTNEALNEIYTAIESVQEMMGQVATASEEQSTAAEQISRNVENVDRITKETATGAEQSASAAEELNRQAEQMKQIVNKFNLRTKETTGV